MKTTVCSERWPWRLLGMLCLAAFLLRLITLAWEPPMFWDVPAYSGIAANLLAGKGYTLDGVHADTYFMPVAVTLHLLAQLVSPGLLAARTLWVLLGAAMVPLAFALGRQLFGLRVGWVFAVMVAVYPYNFIYGMSASTEIPSVLLLMLTAWWLARGGQPFRAGVGFGVACLCRASNLAFLPLVGWWVARPRGEATARQPARCVGLFLLGTLLCIGPWIVRNSLAERTFVPLMSGGPRNVWLGTSPWYAKWIRGEITTAEYSARTYAVSDLGQTTFEEQKKRFTAAILDFIRTNPREFLVLMAFKTLRFWSPPLTVTHAQNSDFDRRFGKLGYRAAVALGFVYWMVLAGAAAAVLVAIRRGRWREVCPLVAWMAFGYAANIWFDAIVRYRYTSGVEMCLLLLAARLTASERKAAPAPPR